MPKLPNCYRCGQQPCECKDGITLYHADCRDVLPLLEPGSVSAVVTDPPYGIKFMGKGWDHGVPGIEFWEAALAACKPGTPLLAFGGTRTYHRLTCAIEDAGWAIRDCLMWLYGSGFPKSLDVSKAIDKAAGVEREVVGLRIPADGRYRPHGSSDKYAQDAHTKSLAGNDKHQTAPATDAARLWQGWGTAMKPAYELVVLAMKPLDGTFAANALEHGVAGLNVDGCRIRCDGDSPSETRRAAARKSGKSGSDLHSALNARADVAPFKRDVARYCEARPGEQLGRWPANVILTHHPECGDACHPDCPVGMLPQKKSCGNTRPTVRKHDGEYESHCYNGGHGSMVADLSVYNDGGGTTARFFYCAKADKVERGKGNTHPTVKPLDLMSYLCRLVSMPGHTGTLLDPFCGSGSTLLAASRWFERTVGIDNDEESCRIAANRLRQEVLF